MTDEERIAMAAQIRYSAERALAYWNEADEKIRTRQATGHHPFPLDGHGTIILRELVALAGSFCDDEPDKYERVRGWSELSRENCYLRSVIGQLRNNATTVIKTTDEWAEQEIERRKAERL